MTHRIALLLLVPLAFAACEEPAETPVCTAELALYFASIPDGDIGDLSMGGVDFEVLSGEVAGYREGGFASILLMNAQLALTPPCDASELELVIDDTQANLEVQGFATLDASAPPLYDERSWSALGMEPEIAPFQRWRLPAPEGTHLRKVVLSTAGQSSVSVLVKVIVFR